MAAVIHADGLRGLTSPGHRTATRWSFRMPPSRPACWGYSPFASDRGESPSDFPIVGTRIDTVQRSPPMAAHSPFEGYTRI